MTPKGEHVLPANARHQHLGLHVGRTAVRIPHIDDLTPVPVVAVRVVGDGSDGGQVVLRPEAVQLLVGGYLGYYPFSHQPKK